MSTENEIKQCPACGEDIKAIAKKCKHCGEMLEELSQNDQAVQPEFKTCLSCGEDIKFIATKCKHCGDSVISNNTQRAKSTEVQAGKYGPGFAITSLVFGILGLLASMGSGSRLSQDEAVGLLVFFVINLVFGIISVAQKRPGKGMAIAGLVLGLLSIL